jgi:hypothetical protein
VIRLRLGSHPGEADLVRLLDRQVDVRTRRRLQGHLGSCAPCARTLEALERQSREVKEALGRVPVQLPDHARRALALSAMERASRRRLRSPLPRGSWMLKAAAVAALLLVVTVSARPSRAWIAREVGRVAVELGVPTVAEWLGIPGPDGGERAAPPPPPALEVAVPGVRRPVNEEVAGAERPAPPVRRHTPPPPPRASGLVSFRPVGEELVLEFDSFQRRGTLSLWMMDVPTASVRASDGYREESFRILRSALRVHNAEHSVADYEVVVPRGIHNVRIRVAGRPKASIGIEPSTSSQPWLWTVDLQRRGS